MSTANAEFKCPKCRETVLAPPSLAGTSFPCPKCGVYVPQWPVPTTLVNRSAKPTEPAVWYYLTNNQKRGPVTESQLRSLIESGMVRATDHVWWQGWPSWVVIWSVPGLLPRSHIEPPPLPVAIESPIARDKYEEKEKPGVEAHSTEAVYIGPFAQFVGNIFASALPQICRPVGHFWGRRESFEANRLTIDHNSPRCAQVNRQQKPRRLLARPLCACQNRLSDFGIRGSIDGRALSCLVGDFLKRISL